ncbi:MAG: TIR domain-containing protein [Pyrinomonadaceae bacterium]
MATRYDVFLSHSSSDKPRVRELCLALQRLGLRVFLDEHQLQVGDSVYSSLSDALETSDYILFCISRASVASGWVEREVGGALATQIKSRRKKVLPVLLDDAPIPSLLSDLVWLDKALGSPTDVAEQIQSAIAAARTSIQRATPYPRDVKEQVDLALSLLAGERAAPRFCWTIVSGPSSAGKDVLSYVVLQRLQQSCGLSFLTKVTTRCRRPSEPNYVEQIDEVEFKRRYRADEIMFPFRKRTFWYGFDGKQFREALREGTPLLSVFTEFRLVPALVEAMNSIGVRSAAFLIQTEKADVLRRVLFRNLSPDEVRSRVVSIEQDYEEMARRATLKQEYVFINNGDSTAFRDAAAKLTEAIRSLVESHAGAATV